MAKNEPTGQPHQKKKRWQMGRPVHCRTRSGNQQGHLQNVLGRTPAEAKAKLKAAIAETKSLYVTKTRTYTVGA